MNLSTIKNIITVVFLAPVILVAAQQEDLANWLPSEGYPRVRPWCRRAVLVGDISFTTPYIDLVTNKLVIALVKPLVVRGETVGGMGRIPCSWWSRMHSLSLSDRGYVLEHGRVAMGGRAVDLIDNPHVKEAYLGL
jgi:hypothetical protein